MSGPITIALIIRTLNAEEQGIYYGIIPVIGIQAFFELGLLNVLISHAGHASEALADADDSIATAKASGRMRELIRASRRWFAWASVLFVFAAIAFGWYTFTKSGSDVPWQTPLLVIVPIAALTVYFAPSVAILEGAGFRDSVYRFRLLQMLGGSLVVWIALASGWGIWALVIATVVQVLFVGYLTQVRHADFFRRFEHAESDAEHFSWIRDVLPQQWRVAASGMAYHLATQFLAIVVLTYHSDAESGRLGMTLSITTAIQMLALAWVQTKYPLISSLHGKGDREAAGTLWRRTAVVSSGLLLAAFSGFAAMLWSLPIFQQGWEDRFIEPWLLVVLGIGCLANHLVAIQAFYVLARGANPLIVVSLIGFLSTAVAVWICGYFASTPGVVLAFAGGMTLITLPLHSWAYRQFRSRV